MWKWLKGFVVGFILLLTLATPVLADVVTVTLYATPISYGLTDFTITYVSDTELDFSWGYSANVTKAMIRGKYGKYPSDIPDIHTEPSDGYLVYYGTETTANDTSMDFDQNPGAIYYKAWGQMDDGTWRTTAKSGWKESAVMTLIAVLLFCGVMSFIALRSSFFGLKLVAGISWFTFFIYFKTTPPSIITEGSAAHTAILVTAIGFGIMIILAGLGRGIQRTEKWNEKGETQVSEGFNFKLPDWLNASEDSPEARKQKTDENLAEYKALMHSKLHPNESRGRK